MKKQNISLFAALLINVNIIIGAGVFLNVKPLSSIAGPLGASGYLLGAILLFPFVFSLAKLAEAHPVSGGLYAYSRQYLNKFLGFISGWVYFVGKTVSAAFLANAFATFFQKQIPFLQPYPTLLLSSIVIFTLLTINIAGARIGGPIQYLFFSAKAFPILFAILFGMLRIHPANFSTILLNARAAFSTIPVALYALMGFEITCSIAHLIEKPRTNVFRAIVWSFLFITTLYILFQVALFGALGAGTLHAVEPVTMLANKIFASPTLSSTLR